MQTKEVLKKLVTSPAASITLKQIALNNKQPLTKESLSHHAKFLYDEVPKRLMRAHDKMERGLLTNHLFRDNVAIRRLSEHFLDSCVKLTSLDRPESNSWSSVDQFSSVLQSVGERLDEDLESAMQSLHSKIVDRGGTSAEVENVIDYMNASLIALRVVNSQFTSDFNHLQSPEKKPRRSIVDQVVLGESLQYTVQVTQSHCIDKLGEAPEVDLRGNLDTKLLCVEFHLHFIIMELLKNSMRAVLERQNRMDDYDDIEKAQISITVASRANDIVIRVSDIGGGLSLEQQRRVFKYFYSTAPRFEPTYTYSGNFGVPFTGLGCGLPLSRLYARYMGGDIQVTTMPGHGTEVFVQLQKHGPDVEYYL